MRACEQHFAPPHTDGIQTPDKSGLREGSDMLTANDKRQLAAFDRLNAASMKFMALKKLSESQLVSHDRTMYAMALIRDSASPALRKALRKRGWQ